MAPKDLHWLLRHGKLRLTAAPTLYRCEPIWSWAVDSLADYALLLTLEGRGEIRIDDRAQPLRQGVCLFIKPTARIEAQQNPSYPLFLFIARFEILDTNEEAIPPDQLLAPPQGILIQNTRHLESLAELIASRGAAGREEDPLTQDAINMLLRLLVEGATRHAGSFDSRAYEALRAIENDLARKWTISALAREAGISPGSFARAFTLMMSEPPIHYVIRRRMEEAKRQIQQSSLPIDEIAINLGYNDLSFFRSLFKRRVGMSPEELRAGRAF